MIRLFQLTPEVYPAVIQWAETPELSEYFRRAAPVMDWATNIPQAMGLCYIIYEDTKPVGLIQLLSNDNRARSIEVAMLIDKASCTDRRVVSKEAYKQIAQYVFYYLDYNKIYMKILSHRDKLTRRLEAAGWQVEGHLRHSCFYKGQLVDETILGLFRADYEQAREYQ